MKLSRKFKVKIKTRVLMILSIFTALSLTLAVDKLTNEQESMIGQLESYMNGEEDIEAIEIASVDNSSYSSSLISKDITTPFLSVKNTYIKISENLDIDVLDAGTNAILEAQGDFTWSSSNEDVATVDENGIVTGRGIGHTTITAYNSRTEEKAKAIINVFTNQQGAITVPQVEGGEGFTVVLKENGTVWSSGLNNYGQLGVGDTIDRKIPVQVKIDENTYLTNVRKISAGAHNVVAMTIDGEVYAWGVNDAGQLGQGDLVNKVFATKVKGIDGREYIESIIDIANGGDVVALLDKTGNIYGIGSNFYQSIDEIGTGNKIYPTKVTNMDNAIQVTSSYNAIGVVKQSGETWIKGQNNYGSFGNGTIALWPTPGGLYYIGTDINEFKLLAYCGYILKEDGTVWSSGLNNYGQLGVGDITNRTTYTQVIFENKEPVKAKTIAGQGRNLQFIGMDGKVYVTGHNEFGQLSNGTNTNASYPIPMRNTDGTEVTDAVLLISGICAWDSKPRNMGIIREDGTVWISGDNTFGQIGNNTNESSSYLTKMRGAFIKYPEETITLSIGEFQKIDKVLFQRQNEMNVFIKESMIVGDLIYEVENEEIAGVTSLGVIEGRKQGITRVKVTDSNTKASTYIQIEIIDVNLRSVIVNDVELQPEETDKYTYKMTIKRTDTKAKVKIVTGNPYATIVIGNHEAQIGESEQWIDLSLDEEIFEIPVIVTSKYGEATSRAIYKIVLIRESNDTNAVISYDGTALEKAEDGKYKVNILDTAKSGKIKVVTNDTKAKVDIGNTTQYEQGSKEYTVPIDPNNGQKTIEVPIIVMAEDGTVKNSTVVINIISTNTNTAKIEGTFEVDGKEITKQATIDEEGKYLIGVKQTTKEIELKITTESQYATITRGTELGKGELVTKVILENDITYVNYEVTAEDENTMVQKTIKIVKQSSDAGIRTIMVEGKEIIADKEGIYHASIEGGSTGAKVIITATSNVATIGISGIANPNTNKALLDTIVGINTIQNTYTITVTAEDGTVKIYTLKITKQTNITGKIITENIEGKYKSFVTVYKTNDKKSENNALNSDIREIIASQETKEDGTFTVEINDIEQYDILVTKEGYLDYRIMGIEVEKGEKTELNEYKLIAGDVVKSGQIEIDDLVALNDNFGVVITDANREQKAIYDLNEDGKVDNLDREILKKNYGKKNRLEQWEDPKRLRRMSTRRVVKLQEGQTNFILPVKCNYTITSEYGTRTHPVTGVVKKHTGIDLGTKHRTEIYAVADGEIVFAGVQRAFGNCIEIKHEIDGETIYSFYAHLSRIDVKIGQKIKQGEVIGLEGGDPDTDPNPGSSTGHHLHFELRKATGYGNDINPRDYIEF